MSGETTPDLTLLLRQQRQMIADMASLRDDMGVMMAILQRLEAICDASIAARAEVGPLGWLDPTLPPTCRAGR